MLLRSGRVYNPELPRKYNPELPRKIREFTNLKNPKFREMWDEMATAINEYFRENGYDKQKEMELFKALKAKIREIVIAEDEEKDEEKDEEDEDDK
jgi:hypothetical protein